MSKNVKEDKLPTIEYLRECFRYNEEEDKLYWNVRPREHFETDAVYTRFINTLANREAGRFEERSGYMIVSIGVKAYRLHILLWKFIRGVESKRILRHIDGNILNNSISNLEEIIPKVETKKKLREGKEKKVPLNLPTQEYLLECFKYEPETGLLYWRERPLYHFDNIGWKMNSFNNRKANTVVSEIHNDYIYVAIDSVRYRVHRVIWKLYHGTEPGETIDHINGIRNDNRICNLRLASFLENSQNVVNLKKNNKSGYVGVCWHEKAGKWRATFSYKGDTVHLGLFDTAYEAHLVREAKAREMQGEFYVEKN